MDQEQVRAAGQALRGAYARGPVEPLIATYAGMTVADAYAVQLDQVQSWTADGAQVRGHKVGLTSAAMQRMLGVTSPDFGHLLDTMFFPEHEPIPLGRFLQPRIEPEVAFVLGSRLAGPGVTTADAVRAVDHMLPALEVVDSRIRDWKIGLYDTIADNASSGGVVLGGRPTLLTSVDLRLVGCNLRRNGSVAATGAAGAVLGNPLAALVWVANVLGERGVALEAGEVVLPGACTAMLPVCAGDTVSAQFAGLGSVTTSFSGKTLP